MGEQSICQARASVMVYDDTSKKWVPIKPGQQGFSRINIYHNTASNTFRVVGVKLQDQQVVINYSIVKGLKYNQATPTFHQWRDARQVYGLNFASKEEATTFSNAMLFALNIMNSQEGGPSTQRQVQNGPSPEEMDIQRRQVMEQQHRQESLERRISATGRGGSPPAAAVHTAPRGPDSHRTLLQCILQVYVAHGNSLTYFANTVPGECTTLSPAAALPLPARTPKPLEQAWS